MGTSHLPHINEEDIITFQGNTHHYVEVLSCLKLAPGLFVPSFRHDGPRQPAAPLRPSEDASVAKQTLLPRLW